MAKNIEMNHLNSNGSYEALYPKTLSQNVIMDSGENLQARIKSVEDSLTPSGTFEIGDLLYTLRDDLDSNWLLCNGS